MVLRWSLGGTIRFFCLTCAYFLLNRGGVELKMDPSDEMRKRIEENLFCQRYRDLGVKECLFSDMVAAVGHLKQQIVQLAYPEFIGREIITVEQTKEAVEGFLLQVKQWVIRMLRVWLLGLAVIRRSRLL